MSIDEVSPDQVIIWESGILILNSTIVWTWAILALLGGTCWLLTRRLSTGANVSRRQAFLEIVILGIQKQLQEISQNKPMRGFTFLASLFLFILTANVLSIVPGYDAPTGSLSTTAALAICVFFAVPFFGIMSNGFASYFRKYLQPTACMLPFNILGEISRSLALAVRLFGNMMSGAKLVAVLLAIVPLFFPVIMQLLGLLTGVIQAYIFSVLAAVYIASAVQIQQEGG